MKDFLSVAVEAAKEAGSLLYENFGKTVELEYKKDQSIVTKLDKESQKIIFNRLKSAFPEHILIGEESDIRPDKLDSQYTWIIDPLDGTHNYVRGINSFGVSIGLIRDKEFLAGVIYLPCEKALYVSEKGSGAFKNDKRIKVSSVDNARYSTLSYDSGFKNICNKKLAMLGKIAPSVFNVRIFGSSVRNLTYLAEGTVDLIIEFDDKIWDFAAGVSLVMEAGGMVTNHCGEMFNPQYHDYLATNSIIHEQILKLMKT